MTALSRLAASLDGIDQQDLSPIEWRSYMWCRCSLAALYGIRADDALTELLADTDVMAGRQP